jgi:hypothetical protein
LLFGLSSSLSLSFPVFRTSRIESR